MDQDIEPKKPEPEIFPQKSPEIPRKFEPELEPGIGLPEITPGPSPDATPPREPETHPPSEH